MKVIKKQWSSLSPEIRQQSAVILAFMATFVTARPGMASASNPSPANATATNLQVKAEKSPPLPLHQIEGNGGVFATLSAYIVNPPRNGELVGRPSMGFAYVHLGHGRSLEALTVTESPWRRLELGYGYNNFDVGDLQAAVAPTPIVNSTVLHNFNARLQVLKEGEFDTKWIPAVTAGLHYKHNDGINKLNNQLGGALRSIGITDDNGVDFTVYTSKLITSLPRPVLFNLGGRATMGVWNGYGGFTDDYSFLLEGNIVVFLTDRLLLAAEYRQQPTDYTPVSLVKRAGDWWTIDAAYVVSKHFTIAAGYGLFGGVVNHNANGVWGITTKWEF